MPRQLGIFPLARSDLAKPLITYEHYLFVLTLTISDHGLRLVDVRPNFQRPHFETTSYIE